jgi:hypothetical protein
MEMPERLLEEAAERALSGDFPEGVLAALEWPVPDSVLNAAGDRDEDC